MRKISEARLQEYWKAIDTLHPKHRDRYCTDDSPNGWGNFGCKRCQAIIDLESKGIKIWPRGKKDNKHEH